MLQPVWIFGLSRRAGAGMQRAHAAEPLVGRSTQNQGASVTEVNACPASRLRRCVVLTGRYRDAPSKSLRALCALLPTLRPENTPRLTWSDEDAVLGVPRGRQSPRLPVGIRKKPFWQKPCTARCALNCSTAVSWKRYRRQVDVNQPMLLATRQRL